MPDRTAKQRYEDLSTLRQPFLDRARAFAKVTIPALIPPLGHSGWSQLPETYQGYSARCVTNLSSTIMSALLPPGQRAFRYTIPPEVVQKAGADAIPKDVEHGLVLSEDAAHREMERRKWRKPTELLLQHLVVAGNAGEQMLPDNSLRVYRLDQYVVVREPDGTLREFVIEEFLLKSALNDELAALLSEEYSNEKTKPAVSDKVCLYTWGRMIDDKWVIHQELNDKKVPGSEGEWDINPFNFLRWTEDVGQDYGRSKVEEHWGDFRAIEGLQKALVEGAALASRHVTMIRPNAAGGMRLMARLAKAANGDSVVGNPEDVTMLQFENSPGMQITAQALQDIKKEVGAAFMLASAAQRDAERVTAYELKRLIDELEGTLGGVYSMLSADLMASRIMRLTAQMQQKSQLPPWPKEMVEPVILTGIEAMAREADVQKVATALQFIANMPDEQQLYVKTDVILGKLFNGLGLSDAVRTDTEVQQIQQRTLMMEAAAQAAGQAAPGQAPAAPAPAQAAA